MKRFYKEAVADGSTVRLDGKLLKTPAKRDLILPNNALAAALADEWQAQGERIKPDAMILMQLVSTAIDREPQLEYLGAFGRTDLLCYRAGHPADLAARQAERWQPWLDWAKAELGIALLVAEGVVPLEQPAASLERIATLLKSYDRWRQAALQALVPALGSLILALAVMEGALDGEAAFDLSQLDENFQAERWGLDEEAVARRDGLRRDVLAAARYLALLKAE